MLSSDGGLLPSLVSLGVGTGMDLYGSETETRLNEALRTACTNDNADRARTLLTMGADVDSEDILKNTPLHDASRSGSLDCVWLLLKAGASVDVRNHRGETPLHGVRRRARACA